MDRLTSFPSPCHVSGKCKGSMRTTSDFCWRVEKGAVEETTLTLFLSLFYLSPEMN